MTRELWLFGYGSLIWRPDFDFLERSPAAIRGFVRRFWQHSPDHRGTPRAPGRVVTLIEECGGHCHGVAYRLAERDYHSVVGRLDVREQEGYRREQIGIVLADGRQVEGLVYRATSENPHFVGEAPLRDIAEIIAARRGPSGSNAEYVLKLDEALTMMGVIDSHVAEIARLVRQAEQRRGL